MGLPTSVFAGNGGNQVLINDGWPSFAESPGFEGYNVIAYGAGPMLKAQNGAYVFMGYSADGGYNSFYETDMPHIRAEKTTPACGQTETTGKVDRATPWTVHPG